MFENKQLVKHWNSSLLSMNKRDEALRATEDAMALQSEQANNINAEMEGLRGSLLQEEQKNEAQMGVLKKVEGEAELVQRNIKQMRDKRKKCVRRPRPPVRARPCPRPRAFVADCIASVRARRCSP